MPNNLYWPTFSITLLQSILLFIIICVIERTYLQLILLSLSKRKYQPFSLATYFLVAVCLEMLCQYFVSFFITNPGELFCFASVTTEQVMMYVNYCEHYSLKVVFLCMPIKLSYHNHNAGQGIKHMTWFFSYIPSNGCLKFSPFSQLTFMQYMGLCFFSLPISIVTTENLCSSSYLN